MGPATQPPGPMAKTIAFPMTRSKLEHAGYRLFLACRFCPNPGSDCHDLWAAARNVQSRFGWLEPAEGLEHYRHNYDRRDIWEEYRHGLPPNARCRGTLLRKRKRVCDRRHTFVE